MKTLLLGLLVAVVAVQGAPQDATPYHTVTGHPGADVDVQANPAIPVGYHVQPSYALDYAQPTIPYNYGPAIRAEETVASPRAPLVMQPEVAFVPNHLNNVLATADDVPVYSNTPVPAPSKTFFQSFVEADAEVYQDIAAEVEEEARAEAEAELEAEEEEARARAEAEAEDQANEAAHLAEMRAEAEAEEEQEKPLSLAEVEARQSMSIKLVQQARAAQALAEQRARESELKISLLMQTAEAHRREALLQAEEAKIAALIQAEAEKDAAERVRDAALEARQRAAGILTDAVHAARNVAAGNPNAMASLLSAMESPVEFSALEESEEEAPKSKDGKTKDDKKPKDDKKKDDKKDKKTDKKTKKGDKKNKVVTEPSPKIYSTNKPSHPLNKQAPVQQQQPAAKPVKRYFFAQIDEPAVNKTAPSLNATDNASGNATELAKQAALKKSVEEAKKKLKAAKATMDKEIAAHKKTTEEFKKKRRQLAAEAEKPELSKAPEDLVAAALATQPMKPKDDAFKFSPPPAPAAPPASTLGSKQNPGFIPQEF